MEFREIRRHEPLLLIKACFKLVSGMNDFIFFIGMRVFWYIQRGPDCKMSLLSFMGTSELGRIPFWASRLKESTQ